MGCGASQNEKENPGDNDAQAVDNFLTNTDSNGQKPLDALWSQFDKNGDGIIDATEFEELIFYSLLNFCKRRNPDLPPPTRENMEPFIKKLKKQLQPYVDKDKDQKITKEEFKGYGEYLSKEFTKLQAELEGKKSAPA